MIRTTYTTDEVAAIWDALSDVYDDLSTRNGQSFKALTVDILGRADDAFKIMAGETDGGAA